MKKILLLASQHGNELLGEKLFEYIRTFRKDIEPFVVFKIANKEAHQKKVRYIDSDMNRSYDKEPRTYEDHQAKQLLEYLRTKNFSLVLDLHTTRCEQPPSFIIGSVTEEVKKYIRASSIEYIVQMTHDIVRSSLIGNYPQSLSLEVQDNALSNSLYSDLCDDIARYVHDEALSTKRNYFKVIDLLYKTELDTTQVKQLKNFELSTFGFYPILVGENSYKKQTNYLGFKAKRITALQRGSRV